MLLNISSLLRGTPREPPAAHGAAPAHSEQHPCEAPAGEGARPEEGRRRTRRRRRLARAAGLASPRGPARRGPPSRASRDPCPAGRLDHGHSKLVARLSTARRPASARITRKNAAARSQWAGLTRQVADTRVSLTAKGMVASSRSITPPSRGAASTTVSTWESPEDREAEHRGALGPSSAGRAAASLNARGAAAD